MSSPLLPLGLGLILGGTATWFALRPPGPASGLAAPRSSLPAPGSLPAWSWRDAATPPLLERNPASAAVSAWLALRGPDGRPAAYATRAAGLRALLLQLPADAFPRLVDGLSRSSSDDDLRLRRIAFSAWTTQDASAATRWAFAQGEKSFDLAQEALVAWAAQDAAAAAAWACALPDEKHAGRFAGQTLAALAEKDPTRALELARSRGDAFRESMLASVLRTLGKKDPAGTLRAFAPELWKNGRGFYTLREVISTWVKQDPSAAVAWLLAQPRDGNTNVANWFPNLDDGSPASRRAVADAIVSAPGVANRASVMRDILLNWSSSHPDDLQAWLRQLPDPDLRLNLIENASSITYSEYPERSLPLTLALPEGANRSRRLAELLGSWAKINSDAALAWMKQHAAEPGVNEASATVHGALLGEIARDDPQAAIAELHTLADDNARRAAADAIAAAWGARDPAAALQWLAAQKNATGRNYLGGDTELLHRWAKTDPEAALRWVETSATGPENSGYTSYYLDALAGRWDDKAPRATTADLYAKIQDPKLRVSTLSRHVKEWLTKDPDGARAWVEANPALTPTDRAKILSAKP